MSLGSSQAGTTTTTNAPYSPYQPYIGTGLGQAANLLQQGGPNYYPGQQVASFNPLQQQSFGNIQGLANSDPLSSANSYTNNMLNGNFSGPASTLANMGQSNNPELSNLLNLQNQSIAANLNSQFAGSGRNIEAANPLMAQTMGNADSQLLSNAYNINQGNQLAANQALMYGQQGAVNNAQNLLGSNLGLQNALGNVGNQVQNQGQNLINSSMNAYNFTQNQPYNNLSRYGQFIQGLTGGTGQQSNPYFQNQGANLLGTALAGQQLYNGMGSKPGGTSSYTPSTASVSDISTSPFNFSLGGSSSPFNFGIG